MSPDQPQIFAASWDSMTKIISGIVAVLLLVPAVAVHIPLVAVLGPLILLVYCPRNN